MYIRQTHDVAAILEQLETLDVQSNEIAILFIGEKNPPDVPALIEGCKSRKIRIMGGIFPGIIDGSQVHTGGMVATKFALLHDPYLFPDHTDLSIEKFSTEKLDKLSLPTDEKPLAFLLSSNLSLTPHAASVFCEKLGDVLESRVKYAGGAAGESTLRPGKYIFDSEGMYCDGSILIFVDAKASVKHGYGWNAVGNPIIVTKHDKNIIMELNGKPAVKFYQEQYQILTHEPIAVEEIDVSRKIHLGFLAGRREKIMRGVIGTTPEGGLILAGRVPDNAILFFMKTTQDAMIINSARMARDLTRNGESYKKAIVVECITRHVLLQDKISTELGRVQEALGVDELVGFLAWGEVTQLKEGTVEFLNESMVIAAEHN